VGGPCASAGARPAPADVAVVAAVEAGVCVRPLPMRVVDTVTGQSRIVSVACGSRLESVCPSCARRIRLARKAQCREGWHLDSEPERVPAGERAAGRRPADGQEEGGGRRVRSTRRRQEAPKLPKLERSAGTLGRTFVTERGRVYRPSMFITLTLPSHGAVRGGVPVAPEGYDYTGAVRDALHFSRLVDRFVQNVRRVAGWSVQYFAVVEYQRRLAPHVHMAIRGTLPRAALRQVVRATYHQVWWPAVDRVVYQGDRLPVWVDGVGYIDTGAGVVLPTWAEALDGDPGAAPLHVARFGSQIDIRGMLGGTADADRCIGYLAKYLTKSVGTGALAEGGAKGRGRRDHVARLLEALRYEPCSPGCANWLRYGVQPRAARAGLLPGLCRGRAHRVARLGYGGRRVLVSRRWGRTLGAHVRDRRAWALAALGVADEAVAEEPGRHLWALARAADEDVAPMRVRVLGLVAERYRSRRRSAVDGAGSSGGGSAGLVGTGELGLVSGTQCTEAASTEGR
jgi:hypothetical protein